MKSPYQIKKLLGCHYELHVSYTVKSVDQGLTKVELLEDLWETSPVLLGLTHLRSIVHWGHYLYLV